MVKLDHPCPLVLIVRRSGPGRCQANLRPLTHELELKLGGCLEQFERELAGGLKVSIAHCPKFFKDFLHLSHGSWADSASVSQKAISASTTPISSTSC